MDREDIDEPIRGVSLDRYASAEKALFQFDDSIPF